MAKPGNYSLKNLTVFLQMTCILEEWNEIKNLL
jgi:hypothetical protein